MNCQCTLCPSADIYDGPSLNCHHKYCTACALKLANPLKIALDLCPICDTRMSAKKLLSKVAQYTPLTEGPINEWLCSACTSNHTPTTAILYCLDCKTSMCSKHEAPKCRNKHFWLDPLEFKLAVIKFKPRKCGKHQQDLCHFCTDCKRKFCVDIDPPQCEKTGSPHNMIELDSMTVGLIRKLEALERKLLPWQAAKDALKDKIASNECRAKVTLDEMASQTEQERVKLIRLKETELKKMTKYRMWNRQQVMDYREEVENIYNEACKANAKARELVIRNNIDILQEGGEVLQNLRNVTDQGRQSFPTLRLRRVKEGKQALTIKKPLFQSTADIWTPPQENSNNNSNSITVPTKRLYNSNLPNNKIHSTGLDDQQRSATRGIFRFKIRDACNLTTTYSSCFWVKCLPWNVMAEKRRVCRSDNECADFLAFFIQCNKESTNPCWSCEARVELRLVNQACAADTFCRKVYHIFCQEQSDWGFSTFIRWCDIMDPMNGFYKDGCIVLEVNVMTTGCITQTK